MGRIIGGAAAVIAAFVLLTVMVGSWYTIDQGERGVILRNSAIVGEADPGLHFKLPIVDDVERVDVREQAIKWSCFDQECVNRNHDWPIMQAYSRDQQPADLLVSVNYSIPTDKVTELYSEYGTVDNLISRSLARKAPQAVKQVFGRYNAQTAVAEREQLSLGALEALRKMMEDEPIFIAALQVENIDYSDAYERAIEERMLAEVEVAKRNQQLETEKINAQIVETTAAGAANARKQQADAEAYAISAKGNAEAEAIRARGGALRDNPLLIDLTAVEKWTGSLPTTMPPGSTVPFINIPGNAGVVN